MQQSDILDTLSWYHIRVHTDMQSEEIEQFLNKHSFQFYFCAYEQEAARAHWQINVQTECKIEDLRQRVKDFFQVKGSDYSVSKKKTTVKKLTTYLLKEGNYFYKGFQDSFIEDLKKLAFKNSKDFRAKYYELDDEYLLTDMSDSEYISRFIDLKLEQRQRWKDFFILEHLDMLKCRKDQKYKKLRKSVIFEKFRNYFISV